MTALSGNLRLTRGMFALDAGLEVAETGITTVCGRSGAGKTTLLRCIAGLEPQVQGRLQAGEALWLDSARNFCLPPERRAVGLVSQDAHLFPHLDVSANLLYGQRRIRGRAARVQLDTVVATLQLADLLHRSVQGLSGGERRRVAIGRALLTSPRLLLLDEPVAALDGPGRREVLDGICAALDALAIPCLYVSHDLHEAARLAQQMLWMDAGRIVASGAAGEVLCDPRLPFAQAEDAAAVVEATVIEYHSRLFLSRLRFEGGELWAAVGDAPAGQKLRVQIAARDVSLATVRPQQTSVLNVIECEVVEITAVADSPAHALVRLSAGATGLLARVTWKSVAELQLAPGGRLWAMVKSVALLN